MEVLTKTSFEDLLADAKSLGNEIENVLIEQGKSSSFDGVANNQGIYVASTSVVSNWISRGIIPPDCILETKNFNGIKLIKDKAFK